MSIASLAFSVFSMLVLQLADTNAKQVADCILTITPRLGSPANSSQERRIQEEHRCGTVATLAKFGEDAAPALPILTQLIFDPLESKELKLRAIRAIGCIGTASPSSLPTLNKLLNDPDRDIGLAAQNAINQIESLPKFLADLSSQDLAIQLKAAYSLSDFGSMAFPHLAHAYLNVAMPANFKGDVFRSMVRATARYDFGPRQVESLICDSNDSRHGLGVQLLVHLIKGHESHRRGLEILNLSSKFTGPQLVRSLFYDDRVVDGEQAGLNLIDGLKENYCEIATAVASDKTRFGLSVRIQAAAIAARTECLAATVIHPADDSSLLLLLHEYLKASGKEPVRDEALRDALQIRLQGFFTTSAGSKELLLELLASDSVELSTIALKTIHQRDDRPLITADNLEKLPEILAEEKLSVEGSYALFSPDGLYVAIWTPVSREYFFGGGGNPPPPAVRVYHTGTSQLIINGGPTGIAPTFSPDSRYLAVPAGQIVCVWDLNLKKVHLELPASEPKYVSFLDGGRVIQCSNYTLMSWGDPPAPYQHFWDTTNGLQMNSGKLPPVSPTAVSKQEPLIAGLAIDSEVPELRTWNVETGELTRIDLPINAKECTYRFSEEDNLLEIFTGSTVVESKFNFVDRFILYDLTLNKVVKDFSIPMGRTQIGYFRRNLEDHPSFGVNPYSGMSYAGVPSPICMNEGRTIEFWDVREGIALRSIDISKTGSLQQSLEKPPDKAIYGSLLPGNQVFMKNDLRSAVLDCSLGELENNEWARSPFYPSPFDGSGDIWASLTSDAVVFYKVQSGESIRRVPVGELPIGESRNIRLSKNGQFAVFCQGNQTRLWQLRDRADLLR